MVYFAIRLVIFISLWTFIMIENESSFIFSLFTLTVGLTFFFFLSNQNASVYLYLSLTLTTLIHGVVVEEVFFTGLLILVVMTLAMFRLKDVVSFGLLFTTYLLYIGLVVYLDKEVILTVLVSIASLFLLNIIRNLVSRSKEYEQSNEQILIEYRQLKRMHVTAEEIARTEERTRIAREIHDSVGHQLTALIMKLEILQVENPQPEYIALKSMAHTSLAETRHAVETLQSTEEHGISAVVQLIRKLEAENQLLITFTIKEGILSLPISNEQGIVLYRVIQEALTNVMRHADSKQVHVSIGKSAIHTLTFKITNPIANPRKFTYGFGLKNMQGRVEEVKGKLTIYQTEMMFVIEGMIPYE